MIGAVYRPDICTASGPDGDQASRLYPGAYGASGFFPAIRSTAFMPSFIRHRRA
jgi:hypothetical protein